MKTPTQPSPCSTARATTTLGRTTLLLLALLCSSGSIRAQTMFMGSWDEVVGGVFSDSIDVTENPYWHTYPDGSTGHYRPGYIFAGIHLVEESFAWATWMDERYEWKAIISEPSLTHHTSNEWSVANAWSDGRPDAATEARVIDSRTIVLPGIHQDPAAARSLKVYDAGNTNAQSVTLQSGTLNLTPASVFDPALTVGVARVTGESRSTALTLSDVTLTSSGFAEIGKGLPPGTGGGALVGRLTLENNSRWLHQAGMIELGGGEGSGSLTVGQGSLLAGSLFAGTGQDPQVVVHADSSLRIDAGGTARLSEIAVNSMGGNGYSGLSVAGNLETNRLALGESGAGRAYFDLASFSQVGDVSIRHGSGGVETTWWDTNFRMAGATVLANSITVDDGSIAVDVYGVSGRSSLTIGTPNPNDPHVERLVLAQESGKVASLAISNSDVTVHSNALIGGYGVATIDLTRGGVLDIRGKATFGESETSAGGAAGGGHAVVTDPGSVLRAQNMEVGYSYFDTYGANNPYPSPSGSLAVGNNGRVEIAGETQSNTGYNWWTQQTETITYHYAGSLTIGRNGTLEMLDGTGQVVFTDPSQGGTLIGQPRLTNYGTIKGGGTGPGPEAQIDFGATGGTLINHGTIDVGHSPGWLTVNGDVSFGGPGSFSGNGRLKIELGGLIAGSEYDVFEILGNADFSGGTLELSFINGYTPLAGDYWDFLRVSGGITGWFSSFVITEGYESYLSSLQGWNGESSFRLYAMDDGGGSSSVPEGGATGLLLTASCLGLLLLRSRNTPAASGPMARTCARLAEAAVQRGRSGGR